MCTTSLAFFSTHFASESNSRDVERLKRDLPSGIAALVDKRSVHGCLSYPYVRFTLLWLRLNTAIRGWLQHAILYDIWRSSIGNNLQQCVQARGIRQPFSKLV
jgi:hypothetical protein